MYTLAIDYGSEWWTLEEFDSKELTLSHIRKWLTYWHTFKIFGPEIKLDLISNNTTDEV